MLETCRALAGDGQLDFYNVIAGNSASVAGSVHIVPPMAIETGYVAPFAAAVRAVVDKPVFVAGRINQPQIAEQVLASVLIADWRCDWIGMGIAEKLVRAGCRVRLAVNGYVAGQRIQQYVRDQWNGTLHKLGVEVIAYARLYGADGDTVYLQHTASGEPIVCEGVDTLVLALGHEQETTLAGELDGWPGELHRIGDCVAPRTAEEAVLEGLKVGCAI